MILIIQTPYTVSAKLEYYCKIYEGFRYLRCMNNMAVFHDYLHYYFSARTRYGVHSPFVYDLICNVINKKTKQQDIREIETLRNKLKKDKRIISVSDYGAGSQKGTRKERSISDIAKHSLKNKKYASLLYRMVNYFKPSTVLELGTCLGITACYLSKANTVKKIITIEGCSAIAEAAKSCVQKVGAGNIEIMTGNFDDLLEETVSKHHPEFIFFDGNHAEEATIRYFETCLPYVTNESIFVFDDINWSEGMKNAWKRIKNHDRVSVTIDLYFLGIVFFRKELSKEDFVVRF